MRRTIKKFFLPVGGSDRESTNDLQATTIDLLNHLIVNIYGIHPDEKYKAASLNTM